jgi:hypothetical protein
MRSASHLYAGGRLVDVVEPEVVLRVRLVDGDEAGLERVAQLVQAIEALRRSGENGREGRGEREKAEDGGDRGRELGEGVDDGEDGEEEERHEARLEAGEGRPRREQELGGGEAHVEEQGLSCGELVKERGKDKKGWSSRR